MNLFTWSMEVLGYAEEIIAGATLLLGGAAIQLGKARSLKNQLLEVMSKSETDNRHFAETASKEGMDAARRIIAKKLL